MRYYITKRIYKNELEVSGQFTLTRLNICSSPLQSLLLIGRVLVCRSLTTSTLNLGSVRLRFWTRVVWCIGRRVFRTSPFLVESVPIQEWDRKYMLELVNIHLHSWNGLDLREVKEFHPSLGTQKWEWPKIVTDPRILSVYIERWGSWSENL